MTVGEALHNISKYAQAQAARARYPGERPAAGGVEPAPRTTRNTAAAVGASPGWSPEPGRFRLFAVAARPERSRPRAASR